eukprot:1144153-Rhodomonas_salina.2
MWVLYPYASTEHGVAVYGDSTIWYASTRHGVAGRREIGTGTCALSHCNARCSGENLRPIPYLSTGDRIAMHTRASTGLHTIAQYLSTGIAWRGRRRIHTVAQYQASYSTRVDR